MTNLKFPLIGVGFLLVLTLAVGVLAQCISEPDADIPIRRMPPGTSGVVVCEGERLDIQPINPTQARLLCLAADSDTILEAK